MSKTTKTKKATANEQRREKAKARNEQRLATTKEQIEHASENSENTINKKAVEIAKLLKETQDTNDARIVNDLYVISSVLCHSKLKRLNADEKTYNKNNVELKSQIAQIIDTDNATCTKYATAIEQLEKLYVVKYNQDGEKEIVCTDKKQAQEIEKRLVSLANNNGLPIVHDAILKLWYYIQKEIEKGFENISDTFLLDTFEKVIPHSKVYRNGELKPAELWQYRTTNAIKETSLEISRQIEKLRPVKDTDKAYIPIATLIENENGEKETITQYKQASIFSVSPTCDINGKIITLTANETIEHLTESLLEKANFTRNESYIFKWYIAGNKTKEQILEKLNISETSNYFEKTVANIRRKCAVVICAGTNYTIEDTNRPNNEQKQQKIVCYLAENGNDNEPLCGQEIATFESIGKASEFLNIDKSNISKVLKRKMKQTKGYIFKYAE